MSYCLLEKTLVAAHARRRQRGITLLELLTVVTVLAILASVALPTETPATERSASGLRQQLRDDHRIEVTVTPFAGRLWLRLSAYLYNEIEDYERLADAVAEITGAAPLAASL